MPAVASFGKGTASGVLRNQKTAARTGNGEEYETHFTAKIRKTPPPGSQPAPLPEVAGWQGRLVRHVMEEFGSVCPYVQILDLPVPQMVESVTDTLRILGFRIAEQVIEVPKISCSPCPSRSLVSEPQSVEQLVDVPTVLSPLRVAEQIVGIPVPCGRGRRRVQGFLPQQSSTATTSYLERISERTVEQIVDFPSSAGGLGQGSSSSAGPADEDFTGGFSHFSRDKKVRLPQPSRVRACPPVSAHGTVRLTRQRRWRSARQNSKRRFALLPKHWTVPTKGGRKRRRGGKEEASKNFFLTFLLWPCSSSTMAMVCASLVTMVQFFSSCVLTRDHSPWERRP